MRLIVGLGNPGQEYHDNRHNIGFMAIDAIAEHYGIGPFRQKFNGLIADGTIAGARVLLLKPQTFMNRSGDSVGQAAKFYKLEADRITVLHDELDLAPGKVRIKTGGGHGGHNGLRSIDPVIGNAYTRVRLGIGHPGHKDRVHGHVLSDFAKADHKDWLDPLLKAIADNAGLLAANDANNFMNRIALALNTGDAQAPDSALPKAPKKQSHIRQARRPDPKAKPQLSGPMAQMLKKLFDSKD